MPEKTFNKLWQGNGVSIDKKTKINVIDYDAKRFQEKQVKQVEECFHFKNTSTVSWIDVTGIDQTEVIKEIDENFGLHPLVLEEIKNLNQRPRIEDFGNYIYIAMKMLDHHAKTNRITSDQISIILGKNFVITFQTGRIKDVFEPVREKIRKDKGKIRKMGADYLVYRLVDRIVDNYFNILEILGYKIEFLEEQLVAKPDVKTLHILHEMKKEIVNIRKAIWPLREVISNLERGESSLVKKATRVYLRDVYYHMMQLIDNIETSRDMLSEMVDIYLSSISNKTNEIMKVLTIIATIFMPLTFIAGMYGMNFKYFPEINWRYGYLFFWIIVITVAIVMITYFKRKKWV
jgi:magnesium transporter